GRRLVGTEQVRVRRHSRRRARRCPSLDRDRFADRCGLRAHAGAPGAFAPRDRPLQAEARRVRLCNAGPRRAGSGHPVAGCRTQVTMPGPTIIASMRTFRLIAVVVALLLAPIVSRAGDLPSAASTTSPLNRA